MPWRNVFRYHAARADDCPPPQRNPSQHNRHAANPDIVADIHGALAKINTLRMPHGDDVLEVLVSRLGADRMGQTVQNRHVVRDQHSIAHADASRRPNSGRFPDVAVFPDADRAAMSKRKQFAPYVREPPYADCAPVPRIVEDPGGIVEYCPRLYRVLAPAEQTLENVSDHFTSSRHTTAREAAPKSAS